MRKGPALAGFEARYVVLPVLADLDNRHIVLAGAGDLVLRGFRESLRPRGVECDRARILELGVKVDALLAYCWRKSVCVGSRVFERCSRGVHRVIHSRPLSKGPLDPTFHLCLLVLPRPRLRIGFIDVAEDSGAGHLLSADAEWESPLLLVEQVKVSFDGIGVRRWVLDILPCEIILRAVSDSGLSLRNHRRKVIANFIGV